MDLTCKFENVVYESRSLYVCVIKNQSIPADSALSISGKHRKKKSDANVKEVRFDNCEISKVPQGLTKIFPNMTVLTIWPSNLKTVNKNDLAEYKSLERFYFMHNKIEFLPGDLFEGFKNLKEISFSGNKLRIIEPNILDGLNVKYVDFSNNPNYSMTYSAYPEHKSNATLEEVKQELSEVFLTHHQTGQNVKKTFEVERQNGKRSLRDAKNDRLEMFSSAEFQKTNLLEPPLKKVKSSESQKGLFGDLKNLIQDDSFKDFKIQIDDHEFHVHKFVLIARSPVLKEIIRNNLDVEKLELVDMPVEIFEIILKYLYTAELPRGGEFDYLRLFAAAGRLKIKELKNFAAMKIFNKINGENALEVLKLGNTYDHGELRQKAFDVIKKKYPKIIFKDKWITDLESIRKIIEKFKEKEEVIRKIEEEFENVRVSH